MSSPLVSATLQAVFLSGLSNLVAQGIKAYREGGPLSIDIVQLFQFVFFAILTCPPNFMWQVYLEEKFPSQKREPDGSKSLNKSNTAKKFALDQTLGSLVNTAVFVATFAAFKGKDGVAIQRELRRDTLSFMVNGWKFWPLVSILNFTVVPMHRRILVGNLAGLVWGILMSLLIAS